MSDARKGIVTAGCDEEEEGGRVDFPCPRCESRRIL